MNEVNARRGTVMSVSVVSLPSVREHIFETS